MSPTTNAAERSLRHLVTCRKISGGTRFAERTATKLALASRFGIWRAQGRNPWRHAANSSPPYKSELLLA